MSNSGAHMKSQILSGVEGWAKPCQSFSNSRLSAARWMCCMVICKGSVKSKLIAGKTRVAAVDCIMNENLGNILTCHRRVTRLSRPPQSHMSPRTVHAYCCSAYHRYSCCSGVRLCGGYPLSWILTSLRLLWFLQLQRTRYPYTWKILWLTIIGRQRCNYSPAITHVLC